MTGRKYERNAFSADKLAKTEENGFLLNSLVHPSELEPCHTSRYLFFFFFSPQAGLLLAFYSALNLAKGPWEVSLCP